MVSRTFPSNRVLGALLYYLMPLAYPLSMTGSSQPDKKTNPNITQDDAHIFDSTIDPASITPATSVFIYPCRTNYRRDSPTELSLPTSTSNYSTTSPATGISFLSFPSTSQTQRSNLTIANQILSAALPQTAFIFSDQILAPSHPITLSFTSKTCTLNPIVSITVVIATMTVFSCTSTRYDPVMMFASGTRTSTFSASLTGLWRVGATDRAFVMTFTDHYIYGDLT